MSNSITQRVIRNYEKTEDLYTVDLMGRYLSAELQPNAERATRGVELDAWYAERDLATLREALFLNEAR